MRDDFEFDVLSTILLIAGLSVSFVAGCSEGSAEPRARHAIEVFAGEFEPR